MKKGGILNAQLMYELTKLRHRDKMVICDVGFPIPKDATVVDVSLIDGVPDAMTTLKAVLNEIIVEEYAVSASMAERNPKYRQELKAIFQNQACKELAGQDFVDYTKDAKFFVRTGEFLPYSNILLVSASGVPSASSQFDVRF